MLVDTSQQIEENESSIKLNEVENEFEKNQQALQIWTEALPATKIFNHDLEINLIATKLFDSMLESNLRGNISKVIDMKKLEN
jgi:lipoate synthase